MELLNETQMENRIIPFKMQKVPKSSFILH